MLINTTVRVRVRVAHQQSGELETGLDGGGEGGERSVRGFSSGELQDGLAMGGLV